MSGIVAVEVAFVGFGSIYFLKAKDDIEYRRKLYNEGSLWLHCYYNINQKLFDGEGLKDEIPKFEKLNKEERNQSKTEDITFK